MDSSDKAITIACVAAGICLAYQIYIKNDTSTKAIAAGLQECMQSNNSTAWQKECK